MQRSTTNNIKNTYILVHYLFILHHSITGIFCAAFELKTGLYNMYVRGVLQVQYRKFVRKKEVRIE